MEDLPDGSSRIVGTKQVIRALSSGAAVDYVIVASDVEEHVKEKITAALEKANVKRVEGPTMAELGSASGIRRVGAACVAVLKNEA